MASTGHGDTETIADTVINHGNGDWDPYEESLAETATVVDTASFKEKSDSKSLALVKEKYYSYNMPISSRPTLFKIIRGLGSLPSRTMNSVNTLAQRMLALCSAEMQIRGAVLANAAVIQRRYSTKDTKLPSNSRNMLTDVPPKQRILRERIRVINSEIEDAKRNGQPTSVKAYTELAVIICTIVRAPAHTYDESLLWRAWDLLVIELKSKRVDALADALCTADCESEDVGTILRHLALARLSGWKKHRALNSSDPGAATELARSAAFSSETYATYLAVNEGFFALLSDLISKRPLAVHEALDDYIHLVWFKYTVQPPLMANSSGISSSTTIPEVKWNYVLDNVSFSLHQYAKRFDPTLPAESRSFTQFIASDATSDGSFLLISHLCDILPHIAAASEPSTVDDRPKVHEFCDSPCCNPHPSFDTEPIFKLFREHPGLSSPELPHPALPILCLIIQMLEVSDSAYPPLIASGSVDSWSVLESLRRLWARQFHLPHDYRYGTWSGSGAGPGRWVPTDKRTYAMRLATCLVVASLARAAVRVDKEDRNWEKMDIFTEKLTATPELESWIWDVISASLCFQTHFNKLISAALNSEVPLTKEQLKNKEIHYIYADALGHVGYLVQYLSTHRQRPPPATPQDVKSVPVEKLVLIFEDVPLDVPCQVLASVLSSSTTSKAWSVAVDILEGCDASNKEHFCRAITYFVGQLLANAVPEDNHRLSRMLQGSESSPDLTCIELSKETPLFMPRLTDRFLMLLHFAVQRKPFIGTVLHGDVTARNLVKELIDKVESGWFDGATIGEEEDSPPLSKVDDEQRQWRYRTCQRIREIVIWDSQYY